MPHMGYKRTGRPTGRPKTHNYTDADWKFAKSLLEDGASYREVAYTTGIPRTTLTDNLPGYGWTARDGLQMYSFNKRHLTTFDEVVYDPKRKR